MLRVLANGVIAFFVLWTLAVSIAELLGITIHFPWIISGADEIPLHRLQKPRIAILLTFAHYGVFHLLEKIKNICQFIFESVSVLSCHIRRDNFVSKWSSYVRIWHFGDIYNCLAFNDRGKPAN